MVSEFRFDSVDVNQPFDGVYPELVLSEVEGQGRRAQDKLTTGGSTSPSAELAHLCSKPLNVSVSRAASTTGIPIKHKCFLNVARKRRRLVG
jgi:hypothetical protein